MGELPSAAGIQWDFGDGTLVTGTLTPTHTYANDGEFVVTLVVTGAFGSVGQDSLMVMVDNVLPVVEPIEPEQTVKAGEATDHHRAASATPGCSTRTP